MYFKSILSIALLCTATGYASEETKEAPDAPKLAPLTNPFAPPPFALPSPKKRMRRTTTLAELEAPHFHIRRGVDYYAEGTKFRVITDHSGTRVLIGKKIHWPTESITIRDIVTRTIRLRKKTNTMFRQAQQRRAAVLQRRRMAASSSSSMAAAAAAATAEDANPMR